MLQFTTGVITAALNGPASVYAADIDSDGLVDVVTASSFDNKIGWYKNGGGSPPTWTAYNISSTVVFACSVHAADIDGDGRMDVLSGGNGNVAWHRNGGGSPPTWMSYTIATAADYMSVYATRSIRNTRYDRCNPGYKRERRCRPPLPSTMRSLATAPVRLCSLQGFHMKCGNRGADMSIHALLAHCNPHTQEQDIVPSVSIRRTPHVRGC
jgi:hypothetical protein